MAAPTTKFDILIQQAFEAYNRQNESSFPQCQYDRAEAFLREAIAIDPAAIEPRHHLANLCSLNGRYDEAVAALEPIKDDPRITRDYEWSQFKLLWDRKDIERAYEKANLLRKSHTLSAENARELLDFARQSGFLFLYIQQVRITDKREESRDGIWIAAASIILRIVPHGIWRGILRKYAKLLQRRGRWRKLQIFLTAASFADRDNPAWVKWIGQVYRITRDVYNPEFQREKLCYENVLRLQPNDDEALNGFLLLLNDLCAWSELDRRFQQLPADALTPWRKSLKAMCRTNLGDIENADRLYQELETTKQSIHARFCRGLLALETNHFREALDWFQTETAEYGYNILNHFFLKVAQYRLINYSSPLDGQSILETIPPSAPGSFHEFPQDNRNEDCVLCGRQGKRQPLWRDSRSGWIRSRCPHCSMISVSPIPTLDEILPLYKQPKGQEKSLYRQAQKDVERYQSSNEEDCRNIPFLRHLTEWEPAFNWNQFESSLGSEKRCLDIGCTAGDLVTLFLQCGWRAEGIDVDPDAISFAQSKRLRARQGTLESLRGQLSTYHLVTLIDVIEHVQNPADLIEQIFEILEPGGLLIVKTPCADSLPHRFLGDRWLESCEHLHFYSRKTLTKLLEQTGFQIIGLKQHLDRTTPYLHPEQWKQRFFPYLLDRWIFKTQTGDTITVLVRKSKEGVAA